MAIESFRLDFDVDIYITGSNAYLLSTEFSTLLSGRYVEIRLLPLSFAEFLTFYRFDPSVTMEDKFQKYLQFGGMPILRQFDFNTARVNEVLEGIYSTVILRDVLERNRATDQALLNKLVYNYEKIVLSMDKNFIKSYEGIKAVNIIDFLLDIIH